MKKNKVYIIAEMACSHEGRIELAKKIIDGAGKAGADAIQFQIWKLCNMMVPHHFDYNKAKKLELTYKIWSELALFSKEKYPNMQIIACVYEKESVDFACSINVDAFKIHSSDLSNPDLIHHIAKSRKRIDLSIGGSTITEIQNAVAWITDQSDSKIWLMYGHQNFPTKIHDIHLNYMVKLKNLFELPIGYQDHTDGERPETYWIPASAIGMGVNIIEKHITHDRSFKGIDHEAALNIDEFKMFVNMVRTIELARGESKPKAFTESEKTYRKYSKKSIVSVRNLHAGETITKDDITFMRADVLGLPPDKSNRIVGKTLKQNIESFCVITEQHVA